MDETDRAVPPKRHTQCPLEAAERSSDDSLALPALTRAHLSCAHESKQLANGTKAANLSHKCAWIPKGDRTHQQ